MCTGTRSRLRRHPGVRLLRCLAAPQLHAWRDTCAPSQSSEPPPSLPPRRPSSPLHTPPPHTYTDTHTHAPSLPPPPPPPLRGHFGSRLRQVDAFVDFSRFVVDMPVHGEHAATGSAMRRRQRRLRQWHRHERMTVAMALAEATHHSAPLGQRTARAGVWGHEQNYTATIWNTPTPQPEVFSLSFEEEPGGARPDRLSEVRPQDRICGAPWTSSSVPCRGSRLSTFLCSIWSTSRWCCLQPSTSSFPSRLSKCPRCRRLPAAFARFSPCRRQRNSWWNSRMSCLSLM